MFILETNVVSELSKIRLGRADKQFSKWADSMQTANLYLSVVTVQKLEIGVLVLERHDAKQGAVFRTWLDHHVFPAFSGRILPIDRAVALCRAKLHVPNPQPIRDGLIAATALVHRMSVVARNVADFSSSGATVINPWD